VEGQARPCLQVAGSTATDCSNEGKKGDAYSPDGEWVIAPIITGNGVEVVAEIE
jgi:hypothetical protein